MQAHILFKPTLDQQKKKSELDETLLNGDFVVRYDVKREATAGDIQVKRNRNENAFRSPISMNVKRNQQNSSICFETPRMTQKALPINPGSTGTEGDTE